MKRDHEVGCARHKRRKTYPPARKDGCGGRAFLAVVLGFTGWSKLRV